MIRTDDMMMIQMLLFTFSAVISFPSNTYATTIKNTCNLVWKSMNDSEIVLIIDDPLICLISFLNDVEIHKKKYYYVSYSIRYFFILRAKYYHTPPHFFNKFFKRFFPSIHFYHLYARNDFIH